MPCDPHRPTYHFSPDRWMNDPIPFFDERDGFYHIFFQHNPNAAFWGDMTWGHAVSRDLVRWDRLPDAIVRTPGGPDADGVFTGCVVRGDEGIYHALYTGIPTLEPLTQVQCRATSRDLVTWTKLPPNPVIARQPPGFGECFRDPHVWREPDGWYMIVGSELPDKAGGAALLYRSDDLASWTYLHPLATGDAGRTNHDFECPDFPARRRPPRAALVARPHVLAERRVRPCGPPLHARRVRQGRHGRVLRGEDAARRAGPADPVRLGAGAPAAGRAGGSGVERGAVAPARDDDGRHGAPRFAPPKELEALRGKLNPIEPPPPSLRGEGRTMRVLDGIGGGPRSELLVRFAPSTAGAFGLRVRASPHGTGGAEIVYDRAAGTLCGVPLMLGSDEPLTLRVYTDGSVVEAFANDRACRTLRTYAPADAVAVGLVVEAGEVRVESIDAWEMRIPT